MKMDRDKMLDKAKSGKLMGENVNSLPVEADLRGKTILEMREKNKTVIGTSRVKHKSKLTLVGEETACDQCFSGDNFTSQYEDESPVNYSLKYSETESCKTTKSDGSKKKFKDYSDYAEDQPTNFSLKYAEKTYEEENKNPGFNYFENHKNQFKEYSDYLETDLDQPTDFTLKYRESVEEEIKNPEFSYYDNDNDKNKGSSGLSLQVEESASDRVCERYTCEDETPLMFSRCSSMNSLSSFVHITQSIPDDRSSIVSEFSRMPSGIITPSELPDSPTQTAPSSPKRPKPVSFLPKTDFLAKKSVFEDDVATYRQEDTPIEFSRTTSLSSLNLDSPAKSELILKTCPTISSLACAKESDDPVKQFKAELLKQDKEEFEPNSGIELDAGLLSDCITIEIQKTEPESCEGLQSQLFTPLHNVSPQSPSSVAVGESEEGVLEEPESDFISPKSHIESSMFWDGKASPNAHYSPENAEVSDKNYPEEEVEDCERAGYSENFEFDSSEPLTAFDEALIEQCISWGMPHKNGRRAEGAHFKDLSGSKISGERERKVNLAKVANVDKSKFLGGKKPHPGILRTLPWTTCTDLTGGRGRMSTSLSVDSFDFDSNEPLTPFEEALLEHCIRLGMPQKKDSMKPRRSAFKYLDGGQDVCDYESSEHITPLETALVDQCIRLGMPQKKVHKKPEGSISCDDHNKMISFATAHMSKLKINPDNEKDNQKRDHFGCMCRRKHGTRRKFPGCGRPKKCRDSNRSENSKI